MPFMADLHMHSSASDGELSPSELMRAVKKAGMNAVALTDHDNLSGLKEAEEEAERLHLRFIPGVELSTGNGGTVHLLAYGMREDNANVQKLLKSMQSDRETRLDRILEKLKMLGMPVDVDIQKSKGKSMGRPHVALEMVRCGYVKSIDEAFALYLSEGKPAYVPKRRISTGEAIEFVKENGGVPVIAHPGLIRDSLANIRQLIEEWKKLGLAGMEVYYPAHKAKDYQPWIKLAEEFELPVTGGSDFHRVNDSHHGLIGACAADWKNAEHDIDILIESIRKANGEKG